MSENDDLVFISGRANLRLARDICRLVGLRLEKPVTVFPDGERRAAIGCDLRRKHVIIFQSPSPPRINDHLLEVMVMVDAARRASAQEITVLLPYFPYARQDRKEKPRVPISSAALAQTIINWGADRIVTLDVHSDQLQGTISKPWDNLYASYCFAPVLSRLISPKTVVVAPDMGAARRARKYAEILKAERVAVVYKERDLESGNSEAVLVIGDVSGMEVLLVDDILAGGGTLVKAAQRLKELGANKIMIAVTHGLFLNDALPKIQKSPISQVYVTDTLKHRLAVRRHPKIRVISVAALLAEAITRIHTGESLAEGLIL